MAKLKITLAAVVLLVSTATITSARDGGLPTLDVQKHCRSRTNALVQELDAGAVASCIKSESEARAALAAAWKDIPQSYKANCIRPAVFSPSYIEWIACLELYIDVKNARRAQ